MMLPATISVLVSESTEPQNQYLIKLFQIAELQLLQSVSMKYGFINRTPGSVCTQTRQSGNLVTLFFFFKLNRLLGVGYRQNNNLPVILVTYTGYRTDRDCHYVPSPFLWVSVRLSTEECLFLTTAKKNSLPIAHESILSLSNLSRNVTSNYSVKIEHILWIKMKVKEIFKRLWETSPTFKWPIGWVRGQDYPKWVKTKTCQQPKAEYNSWSTTWIRG